MALLDLTMNLVTKCSTYIGNPINPPNNIKHIPASIAMRLSNLYSTETIFKESTTHYKNNLRQSGYNKKLTYKPTGTNHQRHSKHKRKIIWFNSLFSKNISIKIGESLLSLLDLVSQETASIVAYSIETKSK